MLGTPDGLGREHDVRVARPAAQNVGDPKPREPIAMRSATSPRRAAPGGWPFRERLSCTPKRCHTSRQHWTRTAAWRECEPGEAGTSAAAGKVGLKMTLAVSCRYRTRRRFAVGALRIGSRRVWLPWSCPRRNRCRARWTRSAIRSPEATEPTAGGDFPARSYSTGTDPAVNGLYQRLVAVRQPGADGERHARQRAQGDAGRSQRHRLRVRRAGEGLILAQGKHNLHAHMRCPPA